MGTCQFAGTPLWGCSNSKAPHIAPQDDHDHTIKDAIQVTHVSTDSLQSGRSFDESKVGQTSAVKLLARAGVSRGDVLDPGGGTNTVISGRGSDVILGTGRGFNTITTGTGRDAIVLGQETTNRIFDFDPANDILVLGEGITVNDVTIQQGTNRTKAGVNTTTDFVDNTLIIDKRNGHVLASLAFTKAEAITEKNIRALEPGQLQAINTNPLVSRFFATQNGEGQLNGTRRSDRLIGGGGNDFLFLGDGNFQLNKATGGGGTEFPFATDSPGTSEVSLELKGGVLKVNGSYRDFDGAPLFSQGETTIDPKARILNGSNPQALVNGFLAVSQDSEGNARTGTHLHFSPAGDDRGNFADATVVRFLKNTPTDAKSGTISGEFKLTPEEQAALLSGNLYVNIHTNNDVDGDGEAGFPTGENRLNLNKNVVKFV
ncbi:MAG: CHRD domain-containing protein [Microcoleus sp. SIO2G3]|nr:CHRD domain-containing protein [Microcoleus sp. SIO2G3]